MKKWIFYVVYTLALWHHRNNWFSFFFFFFFFQIKNTAFWFQLLKKWLILNFKLLFQFGQLMCKRLKENVYHCRVHSFPRPEIKSTWCCGFAMMLASHYTGNYFHSTREMWMIQFISVVFWLNIQIHGSNVSYPTLT